MNDAANANVHATAVLLADTGVLIRGPSGAGKSLLGLALLDSLAVRGQQVALVADDRVELLVSGATILMSPPERLRGLIELRGRGIVERPYRAAVRLDLVVDLVDRLERMPEDVEFTTELLGLRVPRCPVPQAGIIDRMHQLVLVAEALNGLRTQARQNIACNAPDPGGNFVALRPDGSF